MSNNAPLIVINDVQKTFDNHPDPVLSNISLSIRQNEFVTILGQSGCSKSTLLNLIGGFEKPTKGEILLQNKRVTKPGRHCVMLFQDYGLLPWRTVLKNVELGLESEQLTAEERKTRALTYIKLVGLEQYLKQFPHQLSGGMKQRVAIARALAMKPDLILLDEPFAALDTFNRYYLQDELIRLQQTEGVTFVLVTHDIDEAVYLSDRVFILDSQPGRIRKTISIDTAKPRDRSNDDFQYYRRLIFSEFHFNSSEIGTAFNI